MTPSSMAVGLLLARNALHNLTVARDLHYSVACHTTRQCVMLCRAALSVSSPLRAMVGASALDPGQPAPLLQGQTQETALRNGTINISELSLLARPGNYTVSVTLPDYPLVSTIVLVAHESSVLVISPTANAERGPCNRSTLSSEWKATKCM